MLKTLRQTFVVMTVIASMMLAPVADAALTGSYPSIGQLQLDKYIFNPATEDLNISFNLGGDATVMFDVISAGAGAVVKSVNAGPRSKGPVVITWDGNVASGGVAMPGSYGIHVKTQDIYSGHDEVAVNVTVSGSAAAVVPPTQTPIPPTPVPVPPTPAAQVVIYPILPTLLDNGSGTQVATGYNSGTITTDINNATSYTYVYGDGNTTGTSVANGGTAAVMASNSASGVIIDQNAQYGLNPNCHWNGYVYQCTGTVTDTNVQPYIWNDTASPNPYNPQIQGNLAVRYDISTTATVTVQIIQNNNLVKELKPNTTESGTNIAYWNGQYSYGTYVSPGAYRYRITAQNSYGNDLQEGDITVVGNTFYNNYTPYTSYYPQTTAYANTSYYQPTTYANPTYIAPVPYGYISYPCAGFRDVPVTSAYCKAIQELTKMGIFSGYSDGTFRPYQRITRAETTKVVLKALNYPIVANTYAGYNAYNNNYYDGYTNYGSNKNYGIGSFWDLNPVAWYMPYVLTARAYNIIQGYPNGAFKPDNTVNRVELLKVLLRAANYQNLGACPYKPYSDTPIKADTYWYIPYACFARQYLLIDPTQDGKMLPAEKMTRGDVAMLIYRAYAQGLLNYKAGPIPGAPVLNPVLNPVVNPTACATYTLVNGQYVCYQQPNTTATAPTIQSYYLTSNPYNPFKNVLLGIYYNVSPASTVTVQILRDNVVIKTVKEKAIEVGSNTAYWDGKNTNGFYVDLGAYKYRILAANSNGVTRVVEGTFSVINY